VPQFVQNIVSLLLSEDLGFVAHFGKIHCGALRFRMLEDIDFASIAPVRARRVEVDADLRVLIERDVFEEDIGTFRPSVSARLNLAGENPFIPPEDTISDGLTI
jgi:hypothetical protein